MGYDTPMPTDHANHAFRGEENTPTLLNAAAYQRLLETLATRGKGYGKTESVAGFLLRDLQIVTETESGKDEVGKTIGVEPYYLVMDQSQYPNDYVRTLVVKDIMLRYAQRVLGENELNSPDFKGPGLWTSKKSAFEFDYRPAGDGERHVFAPSPEATRVCLTMDRDVVIPTQWGKPFTIEKGGTLAIREQDMPQLLQTLNDIRSGKVSAEDALLQSPEQSVLDCYGMNPGFLEDNYGSVELKSATTSGMAALRRDLAGHQNDGKKFDRP
jgi:hypothetical protein